MEDIPKIIHESWHQHLEPLFQLPEIQELKSEVLVHGTFYPPPEDIFRVFRMPLSEIKVVILGQDPYPKKGQAIGLAFAVSEESTMPASLKVIHTELLRENVSLLGFQQDTYKKWKTLDHWVNQGVFLLNTALTVRKGESGSHQDDWKDFIEGVVRIIAEYQKPIWLLWGAHAREMGQIVFEYHEPGRIVGSLPNRTMSAGHPVTEIYGKDRGGGSFYGCNHFKKVNDLLTENGKKAINW